MRNYFVFDFETTGFDATKDRVTQMTAGRVVNCEVVEIYNRYIKLDIPVPPKITEITGIDNKLLDEKGVDEKEAFHDLYEFIGEKAPLLGHNSIKFDRVFLNFFLKKHGLPETNNYRHIDTAVLFKARELGIRRRPDERFFDFGTKIMDIRKYGLKFNLLHCCDCLKLNVTQYQAHRSDSDIMMTHLVYQHFYQQHLKTKA